MAVSRPQQVRNISTHAPAWGATSSVSITVNSRINFYSRPRVGGDSFRGAVRYLIHLISTHAPAWGATPDPKAKDGPELISTHAPAWGATKIHTCNTKTTTTISTHAPAWGAT